MSRRAHSRRVSRCIVCGQNPPSTRIDHALMCDDCIEAMERQLDEASKDPAPVPTSYVPGVLGAPGYRAFGRSDARLDV